MESDGKRAAGESRLARCSSGKTASAICKDPITLGVAFLATASALFWLFPNLDLWTSAQFYEKGDGFFLSRDLPFRLIREIGLDLTWAYAAIAVALLLAAAFSRSRRSALLPKGVFLVSVMLIGPGLLVNLLLKNNWGRARPHNVLQFGGTLPYSRVWEIVPYCTHNCSFVSGEAAASFSLLALAFVVPRRLRTRVAVPLVAVAAVVSFDRIIFGGHFLSDTILSWALVMVVILVLDRLINRHAGSRLSTTERGEGVVGRRAVGLGYSTGLLRFFPAKNLTFPNSDYPARGDPAEEAK